MQLKSRKILAVILIFTMVLAAGCQAVAGLDLNQMLKNMMKVTSAEGKVEYEFKLNLNEDELTQQAAEGGLSDEEAEEMLQLLRQYSHIKLVLDKYKVEDETKLSMEGSISFGEQDKLGFDVKMNETLAVIKLDGAKEPFSIDLTGKHAQNLERKYYEDELGWDYEDMYGTYEADELALDEEAIVETVQQISELISNYTIERLPNIDSLSVTSVNEEINGINTDLLAVKGEIKGMELWSWAKKLIDSIASDREGLEKLVGDIITIYEEKEELFASLGAGSLEEFFFIEEDSEEEGTEQDIKQLAVDELVTALQELQQSMLELEQEEEATLKQVLNDSLLVTFDYGVDKDLNVRKQGLSIQYSIDQELKEELELYGIDGFSLTSTSQLWNVNGDVKADEPRTTLFTVSLEALPYMEGFEIAALFEEDSFIDHILREQLHITEQYYFTYPYDDEGNGLYLNEKKQAMIPARDIIEEFGGKVSYNHQDQSIVLEDRATGSTIIVVLGSNRAIVNGKVVEWSSEPEVRNGVVYVPARSLAEALQADITWYNPGFIEITREP